MKEEQKSLQKSIEALKERLEKSDWGKNEKWWREISEFLEDEYYNDAEQLQIPSRSKSDNFKIAGKEGKEVTENYLWERWCEGKDRGIFQDTSPDIQSVNSIWKLSREDRKSRKLEWNNEWQKGFKAEIASKMVALSANSQALISLRQSCSCRVLKDAVIIGCTTVKAAEMRNVIEQIAPSVVVVEEAAEILEAHILTTLSTKTQQLIMIGDHFQLRPKLEHYQLRKESHNCFDLDVSLFERLFLAYSEKSKSTSQLELKSCLSDRETQNAQELEVPLVVLNRQHRMRPEISKLIRSTVYPELEDAESVKGRANIRGVDGDVVFVDHRHLEMADEDASALGSNSKLNEHEAKMVAGIACYLLSQNTYKPHQLTILTPYLGQLSLIRKCLGDLKFGTLLTDKDRSDLIKLDPSEDGSHRGSGCEITKAIRVATIDNYQGEEADITVVSLVRSNKAGDIGFCGNQERVNVMLSRARLGMYVVGNFETFRNCKSRSGRNLWNKILKLLDEEEKVLEYFPAKCQIHSTIQQIAKPDEFCSLAPHGGCAEKCKATLPCDHQCPLSCHPGENHDDLAVDIKCEVSFKDVCPYNHPERRQCGLGSRCMKKVLVT